MRSVMPFYESIGTVVRRVYDLRIEGPPRGRLPPASDRPRWLRFGGSRAGFHRSDPLLRDDPFVAIHGASHTVLRLAINQWQQPQNDVRPTRYQRMRPAERGHYCLPHLEAMVRHGAHMVRRCTGGKWTAA